MEIGKNKIIFYFAVFCLVIFWLTVALTRSSAHKFNLHGFIVQSRSMETALKAGSLIIVKAQPNYAPGDIITFIYEDNPNKNTITHRIFKIVKWNGEDLFSTKGDANFTVDSQLIKNDEIIGKVICQIPYIGMFIAAAQTKIGSFFYVIFPAIIIMAIEIKNILTTLKAKG